MKDFFMLWLLLFLFSFFCTPTIALDEQSLLDFKSSVTSDPFNVLADWLPNTDFCNWTGVTCDPTGNRVESLMLLDTLLGGSISPSIANISSLTQLVLINNSFGGKIPQELGRLQNLKVLYLAINSLEGSIPSNLSACRGLEDVSLGANQLIGTIPGELGQLANLRVLRLGSNRLTGNIPLSLANLTTLEVLSLEYNDLEGNIPPELGRLSSLSSFILLENPHITGPIPSSLSNMSRLEELALYSNSLTGPIPPELGKLSNLTVLYLWDNQLNGTIPATLANCSRLSSLDLELNHLTGTVPLELSKLLNLKFLSLSSNQLISGSSVTIPILIALSNSTRLNSLLIHSNYLSGSLPSQLPTNLTVLNMNNNNITGNIPSQIANLTNLRDLDLSSNLLTGSIPSSLRRLQNLQRLWLDHNRLEGSIPSEVGEITNLGLLSISHNMLSEEIPDTISGLQQLTSLVLHHNQLSGNIPASLGTCYKLEKLDLSYNNFTGKIPREVAGLSNLQFYFNLSSNLLQGSMPIEIGKMTHVQAIDISANRIEGQIPATLGSCEQLQYLNLSFNGLKGSIPNSLDELKSLVGMDLSSNNLSGSIPVSLTSLDVLQYVNFSFNNLSGKIPEGGVFKNLTAVSLEGNPLLCGELMNFSSCPLQSTPSSDNPNKITIIASVIGSVVFLLCLVLILGILYRRHKIKSSIPKDTLTMEIMDDKGISYKELVEATEGFDQKNLLGTGSFGSVFRGILSDGTVAAIKLLNLQNEDATKSFSRECKVLAKVRHRNLTKIISYCLEFGHRVLVLQFMSNGNLDKMLHSDADMLSFKEILNIAIDVIHGVEYLHHDCFVQVVHCDIKPSNILLDEAMTAHVSDFGISQIICGSDSMDSASSTLSLKGSMGYIAPEYGFGGKVTTKGDIYSYGIMLLEMITRKAPTDHIFGGELNLRKWVSMNFPGRVEDIVDWRVMRDMGENEINRCLIPLITIGLKCSTEHPNERPTAREVSAALESIRIMNLARYTTTTRQPAL